MIEENHCSIDAKTLVSHTTQHHTISILAGGLQKLAVQNVLRQLIYIRSIPMRCIARNMFVGRNSQMRSRHPPSFLQCILVSYFRTSSGVIEFRDSDSVKISLSKSVNRYFVIV
jgi:hypothetical protein